MGVSGCEWVVEGEEGREAGGIYTNALARPYNHHPRARTDLHVVVIESGVALGGGEEGGVV